MKPIILLTFLLISVKIFSQNDTTVIINDSELKASGEDLQTPKVFYGQRLINANTVEVLRKGVMEFRVSHNFDDIGGDNGKLKNFFGLDNSTDVRIGFQLGVVKDFNILASHSKDQYWELGGKYQLLHQDLNKSPFSLTAFASIVSSSRRLAHDNNGLVPGTETSYQTTSDRFSQAYQLMLARHLGAVSLQFNPTFVHRNFVVQGDDNSIFALGGALRIPITKGFILIADYFHPFRSERSKNFYADTTGGKKAIKFYDPIGIGFEFITRGHVFHLNFTNSREILEPRFISNTTSSWGKGQFRWAFNFSRNFTVFRDKKNK